MPLSGAVGRGASPSLLAERILMSDYSVYRAKNTLLGNELSHVSALEFYQDIFPAEGMESRGGYEERANPIVAYTQQRGDKRYMQNEIMFSDYSVLNTVKNNDFAICSLCSYAGKNRTSKNAYKLHGIAIDLDGVGMLELETLFLGVEQEQIPAPTYLVNSGHGVHVYYVFENPVPLYPAVIDHLQRLKRGLTDVVWTRETSTYKPTERQYQGIFQGFRMPSSHSKIGRGKARNKYPVEAYRWWRRVTLEYLNQFVAPEYRVPVSPDYASWEWADEGHLTLDEAKKLYPEWYQKRIIEKKPAGQWVSNPALYKWWLEKLQRNDSEVRDGNRYNCIAVLFIMAIKCNIEREFVLQDALELVEPFNELTIRPENEFTREDVFNAIKYYKPSYARYSINAIEARTGIKIERRQKPKRSQVEHLKRERAVQMVTNPDWREGNGRKPKKEMVLEWRKNHPDGIKAECVRETGLTKPTVYRWWNAIPDAQLDEEIWNYIKD